MPGLEEVHLQVAEGPKIKQKLHTKNSKPVGFLKGGYIPISYLNCPLVLLHYSSIKRGH